MIQGSNKKISIFAYIKNPMKNLSKRAKLIILLVAVNVIGYGVTMAYFASNSNNAKQDSFILSGLKSDKYYQPSTSSKLVDYCITLMRLIKQS